MSREVFRLRAFRGKAKKSRDFTRGVRGLATCRPRDAIGTFGGTFRDWRRTGLCVHLSKKRAKTKIRANLLRRRWETSAIFRFAGTWHEPLERVSGTDVLLVVCVIAGTTAKVAAPTVLSARRDGRERGVRACGGSAERAAPVSVPAPPHGMDVRPGLGPERPDARASVGIGRHATRAVAGRRPRVPVVPARARARLDRDPHPRLPSRRLDVRAPAPRLVGLLRRRRGRAEPKPKRIHG